MSPVSLSRLKSGWWLGIVVYTVLTLIAVRVYPFVPRPANDFIELALLSLCGPSLALFTHWGAYLFVLFSAAVLPFFMAYFSHTRYRNVFGIVGLLLWLCSGALMGIPLLRISQ